MVDIVVEPAGLIWGMSGTLLASSGRLLAGFWPLLGASWQYFGRSVSNFFETLVQDGLRKAFGIDFGWILGGLGEAFGQVWATIWKDILIFQQGSDRVSNYRRAIHA